MSSIKKIIEENHRLKHLLVQKEKQAMKLKLQKSQKDKLYIDNKEHADNIIYNIKDMLTKRFVWRRRKKILNIIKNY